VRDCSGVCYNNNIIHSNGVMKMRVFSYFRLLLCLLAIAAASFATAQEAGENTPPAEELELIDEVEQPTITIRKPDATKEITERKEHGELKEIKVQTGVGTYYLYPNKPLGGSFDDMTSKSRPAMWRIHEFDLTSKQQEVNQGENEDGFDYTSDAPTPPSSQ
jgi:hypothetical protein